MRFDEIRLAEAGDEVKLRFDPCLTVLAGVGPEDRADFIASLLGTLTGDGRGGVITGTDHTGRPLELRAGQGRVVSAYTDDRTAGPRPVGWLAPDENTLRQLLAPATRDLDVGPPLDIDATDPPELAAAKAELRGLEEQRRMALSCREQADASAERVQEIDTALREAAATADRRAYLAATAELKQVKAEAEAVGAGVDSERVDQHLVEQAANLDRLDCRWREAKNLSSVLRRRLGDNRFDDVTVRRMATVPAEAPTELARTLQEATMTRARVAALEDRLRDLATGQLPPPADERVLNLATADQAALWGAFARLEAAQDAADHAQIRLGGLGPRPNAAVETLEEAHARWEDADRLLGERRVVVVGGAALIAVVAAGLASTAPLAAAALLIVIVAGVIAFFARPWRARAAAARDEAKALVELDAPTYLAFHLRRVEASFDSDGRDQAELAATDVLLAERDWRAVAGEVTIDDARAMRVEVAQYAAALQLGQHAIDEVSEIRERLVSQALPERDAVHERLVTLLTPYRVEAQDIQGVGSEVVAATVAARIDMGSRARQQQALESAEADERDAAHQLGVLLDDLGQGDGETATRVEAARWAVEQAAARQAVRTGARSHEQIAADLERLQAEITRLHRPEYAIGLGNALPDVDVESLQHERSRLQISLADMERVAATVGDLDERRRAVQARITELSAALGIDDAGADGLREGLLQHLARAAQGTAGGEPVPVVLNDPVSQAPEERRWELMDLLRRLSEHTQVIYLTSDAWIGAWARRRAEIDETILLLEPVE